jgi:uncharacterized protein YsxB (DUF464 family)
MSFYDSRRNIRFNHGERMGRVEVIEEEGGPNINHEEGPPLRYSCSVCTEQFGNGEFCENCGWNPSLEEELNRMNEKSKYRNIVAIINGSIVTVKISFVEDVGGKLYTYKCEKGLANTLSKGDTVVVESRSGLIVGYVNCVDEEVDIEPESEMNHKYIVQKVDTSTVERLKKIEELNVETMIKNHRSAIRKQFVQSVGCEDIKFITELPE